MKNLKIKKVKESNNFITPITCSVCGRSAKGYHYDVISCKGCKTFFRRMYLLKSKIICGLNNSCFDLKNKNEPYLRCRACRYKKCIDVGMNRNGIQSSESKKEFNKTQKLNFQVMESADDVMNSIIERLSYVESKLEIFRTSSFNPQWSSFSSLKYLLEGTCQLSSTEKSENGLEKIYIIDFPTGNQYTKTNKKIWTLCNLLTITEYIKTFECFHKISSNDRLVLTRHIILMCKILHESHYAVSRKFDNYLNPDGTQESKTEMHHSLLAMSISPLVRTHIQPVEYVLLKAMCFCNPAVTGLSQHAQTTLAKERQQFGNLLFDLCRKNRRDGPGHFVELVGILGLLENQQRMLKDTYMTYYAPFLSPEDVRGVKLFYDIMSS